LLNPESNY